MGDSPDSTYRARVLKRALLSVSSADNFKSILAQGNNASKADVVVRALNTLGLEPKGGDDALAAWLHDPRREESDVKRLTEVLRYDIDEELTAEFSKLPSDGSLEHLDSAHAKRFGGGA